MRHTALLACLLATLVLGACTSNPATGRRQFTTMSTEQEIALGEEAQPELIAEYGGEVPSSELRRYLSDVGHRLAAHVEEPYLDLPWEFTLLDSDVINAFALPGGKVFMSRGLMERFENEAQVAGVLGHEIGHVTGQHVDERISHATGVQYGVAITQILTGQYAGDLAALVNVVVGAGGQGYLLSFNRSQESEADVLGVKYMTLAGYDPQGLLGVLEVLREAAGDASPPELLSTHPHPETRLETVGRLLAGDYAFTQNNPDYGLYADRFEQEAAPYLARPVARGRMLPFVRPEPPRPPDPPRISLRSLLASPLGPCACCIFQRMSH